MIPFSDSTPLIATTLFGLEEVLAEELRALGAGNIHILNRAVSFTGDQALMYKANLCLRTALRILRPIFDFTAENEQMLYQRILDFDWAEVMSTDTTFAIHAAVSSPHFSHSQYVALKTKDAIVDQFRAKTGKRPSVDIQNPHISINIHITGNQVSLALDSSGESLHRRGYRTQNHRAPLNEVLAAGLLHLAGWSGEGNLVDPMCGSGTIPIEAALIATNTPPGIFRRNFGFRSWRDYDHQVWQKVKNEARRQQKTFTGKIEGSDISSQNLALAYECVKNAGFETVISLSQQDFLSRPAVNGGGILMINPPYGERLEENDIESFYRNMGDRMKKNWAGYNVWIISSNTAAMKSVGLRPDKKLQVYNGSLACKFYCYRIFEGSRKVD
ncbi:MAG: THUMP domain-containing protein [Bacteroidia bacterium]|nr:THUMP domain-containing protein [Bacteroidia bacterium]